jgi:hypothetical protein
VQIARVDYLVGSRRRRNLLRSRREASEPALPVVPRGCGTTTPWYRPQTHRGTSPRRRCPSQHRKDDGACRHVEPAEADRPLAGFASHLCDIEIALQSAGNRRVDLLHGEADEAEPREHDEPITEPTEHDLVPCLGRQRRSCGLPGSRRVVNLKSERDVVACVRRRTDAAGEDLRNHRPRPPDRNSQMLKPSSVLIRRGWSWAYAASRSSRWCRAPDLGDRDDAARARRRDRAGTARPSRARDVCMIVRSTGKRSS